MRVRASWLGSGGRRARGHEAHIYVPRLAHARRSAESGVDRRVLLAPAGGACVARHLDIARPAEPLPGRDDAVVARVTRSEEATLDLRWALRGDDARGRSAGHERLAPVRGSPCSCPARTAWR